MKFDATLVWDVCTQTAPEIHDDRGLMFRTTRVGGSLREYDLVVVPGGKGTDRLKDDRDFAMWLQSTREDAVIASVCTGALLLGAAGFLRGRRATTHAMAFRELESFGAICVDERVVDEGKVVTVGGVTAALDLGLHLVGRYAGQAVRAAIQRQMEYRASPEDFRVPFGPVQGA